MSEPIRVDLPYPTVNGIFSDALSLRFISPAYASSTGELNAVLQYLYHSFVFRDKGLSEYADKFEGIAIAEMFHLKLLGETIAALGAAPVFTRYPPSGFDFYSAKYVSYSRTLENMFEDDILGERHAIREYECILKKLKSERVKAIIERIILDEKLHLETLEKMLCDFKR